MAEDDIVMTDSDELESSGAEPADLIEEVLVESVSIDGMCGVY